MAVAPPLRKESRLRSLADFYLTNMRTSIQVQLQYRFATYMYLLGMVAEPVIYLVVWTTIAREHGGQVAGVTAGQFAAYFIVWTLVRNMNIVFTPYGWESRIREGQFSALLARPIHPIHYDIAQFAGSKVVWVLLYLPIAAGLTFAFRPSFFPIQSLVGGLTPAALLGGLGMQFGWIGLGAALVWLTWGGCVKRYAAVGN